MKSLEKPFLKYGQHQKNQREKRNGHHHRKRAKRSSIGEENTKEGSTNVDKEGRGIKGMFIVNIKSGQNSFGKVFFWFLGQECV